MMKYPTIIVLCTLLILSCFQPLAAAPPLDTDSFRYLGDVLPVAGEAASFFILEISPAAYAAMDPAWRDLRIFNNSGQEAGYTPLLHPKAALQSRYEECEIINKGMLQDAGKYSFTLKDLPPDTEKLTVRLDKPEYLVKSDVYGSNDNQTWQLVGTQTLYGINGNYNTFPLRDIEYRYIKFEFTQPPGENLSVSGVQRLRSFSGKKTVLSLPVIQSDVNKTTVIVLDLGCSNYPSRGLKFTTSENNFYRQATLEASNGQDKWQYVSAFYLYSGSDPQDENLSVEYPLTRARYLKITVQNGDSAPVTFSEAAVETESIRLLVKDSTDHAPFKVYWGNPPLPSPRYDVDEILAQGKINPDTLPVLHLDNYTENPTYKQPAQPLTERYPFLLPLALAVAIVFIGAIQYKALKKMKE